MDASIRDQIWAWQKDRWSIFSRFVFREARLSLFMANHKVHQAALQSGYLKQYNRQVEWERITLLR